MGRTRCVGLRVADLAIAVEAPPALPWRWRGEPAAAFAAPLEAPDVCIGVRLGGLDRTRRPDLAAAGRQRLEVHRHAGGWLVQERRGGRVERELRVDLGLRAGEVRLDPAGPTARRCAYPLHGALEAWLVRHRVALDGGLALPACAAVRRRRAMLFAAPLGLAPERLARALARVPGVALLAPTAVVLRPDGARFRAHATPWGGSPGPGSAPLEAVHLVHAAPALAASSLGGADAVAALLGLLEPLASRRAEDVALAAAERLADRVPVVRVGLAELGGLGGVAWGPSAAAGRDAFRAA